MSDKDFDKLFQEKFESFRVEPSSSVWRGIEAELKSKGQKKIIPVFWITTVAASLLMVLSAGLWMVSPKEKIKLQGKSAVIVIPDVTPPSATAPVVQETARKVKQTKSVPPSTYGLAATSFVKPAEADQKQPVQEIRRQEESPATKQVEIAKVSIIKTEKPKVESTVPKEVKTLGTEQQPALAFVSDRDISNPKKDSAQQQRIRTVGDLVNFVVKKVDPRTDKLIQFSNDEEGGSEISGINLGLVKFKSRNNR